MIVNVHQYPILARSGQHFATPVNGCPRGNNYSLRCDPVVFLLYLKMNIIRQARDT